MKSLTLLTIGLALALGPLSRPATAGSLSVLGNLSAVSNLTAAAITLNGQTITNWPGGNLSGGVTVLTNAVLDFSQTNYFYQFTLTADTAWSFTNHVAGRVVWLQITQDGVGGHSNSWPANVISPAGVALNNTAVNPNSFSVFQLLDNGSSWLILAAGLNYSVPCTSNCASALQFDGSQNYVDVPAAGLWPVGNFTIEFWAISSGVLAVQLGPDDSHRYALMLDDAWGPGGGAFVQDGSTNYYAFTSASLSDGNWHHVAMSYDGTNLYLFIDGTNAATTPASIAPFSAAGSFTIGYATDGLYTSGTIDEVRISGACLYTANFTPPSCLGTNANTLGYWQFNEGSGTITYDGSGNGNDGTLQGAPVPAWVTGITCGGGGSGMGMMMGRFGGSSMSFGMSGGSSGGSSGTITNSPVNGSSMTITDTLGRIWGLVP